MVATLSGNGDYYFIQLNRFLKVATPSNNGKLKRILKFMEYLQGFILDG